MNGNVKVSTRYRFECFDKDGNLRWEDEFENQVVTAGLNKLLDACFKTGLATPAWYVGLKDAGTVDPADTMASHAGWPVLVNYSNAARPAFTPGAISGGSVDNSASKAVFNINADDDVYGAFLTDSSTKNGTTGTLYGAGDFSSPKPVLNGDTLNVTVTLTVTAI